MRPFDRVSAKYKKIKALDSAIRLFNWDQQVLMPSGGIEARSQHLLLLSSMQHKMLTSDELSNDIEKSFAEASDFEEAQLRVLKKDVSKAKKLPSSMVQRKAAASSAAYQQWRISRPNNDFSTMISHYTELFDVARESAELFGYDDHPYDALINLYEEGATHAEATKVLGDLKAPTKALIQRIREEGSPVDGSFLIRDWDQSRLKVAMERVVSQIGFNFDHGRLDISSNAFCTNLSISDVRMTTRPSDHFRGIVSSSLHEMGHGLYEQNQRPDWEFTPLCGGASLAVHESQSRTWENVIGRSSSFWEFFWIWFREQFPFLKEFSTEQFLKAYNKVEPGFIRVGSDELHYNLHIALRFELESEIITNKLAIKDLPDAWNSKFHDSFGLNPESDTVGCLQDVHWSRGSVGYFPTYSYGNVIGVQIWNKLVTEVGDVEELISTGNFRPILDWLTERVYGYGRMISPKDLVENITDQPISAQPWLDYATKKFTAIYDLK